MVLAAVLCCALAGVEVLSQEDEPEEVGWAQGAGTVAAERTGSWLAGALRPRQQLS